MKRLTHIVFFLLFIPATAPLVHAQWYWRGALDLGLYQNQNIFKSPDRLARNGVMLGVDSLYQNDVTIPLQAFLAAGYTAEKHRIRLYYRSNLNRYGRFDDLNGGSHSVRLTDTWKIASNLQFLLSGEGRRSRRVGTNILGDQLARLFEYTGVEGKAAVRWRLKNRRSLTLGYALEYRDYTETDGSLSLDSYSHFVTATWNYRSKKTRGQFREVDIEVEYRRKEYTSYLARSKSGIQHATNPVNRLHYADVDLDFERAFSRFFSWSFGMGGRYRHDPFQGYYSYGSGHLQTSLSIHPVRSVEIEMEASLRHVRYPVKDAPQFDTTVSPNLQYDYVDWSGEVNYLITPAVSLLFFIESDSRRSNVTRETSQVRRSYDTLQSGIQLRIDLDELR